MSEITCPDIEAAYWVIPLHDGFSAEVITSDNHPIIVSPFATATDAKAWIAKHRQGASFVRTHVTSATIGRDCCVRDQELLN